MNKNILHILFSGCFFCCFVFSAYAQSEKHYIREGNKQFRDATIDPKKVDSLKYKNAENLYKNALDEKPDSYEATYNLGNAYYRQKNFKDAVTQYKIAANKQMPKKEQAWNFHNMGNTLLQSGQIEESIDAYKSSLKINPHDKETKYNLAYAQYMLKKQQQQQKQDQKDQNKDQNKDQQKQDQKQDQKDKQDQQKQDQKQDQQDQKQDQKQAQKKDQISKEDAQRMLEALQNDEKKTQEKLKKEKVKGQRIKIEKDW